MASQARSTTPDLTAPDLIDHLEADGHRYAFFQVVEMLQQALDDGREVGTHARPRHERLRFSVDNSLGFPTSDVAGVKRRKTNDPDQDVIDITVNFMGLHGSTSPLPTYYQERAAQYVGEGSVIRDFQDFFHHRLIGLLHRAMKKYRYFNHYRPAAQDGFSQWIFSLFGLADQDVRQEADINWPRLLSFVGLMSARNRSATTVATLIKRAFLLDDVVVEQWVPRRVDIQADQKWKLGGATSALGQSTIVGDTVPDMSGKFRLCINNLTFERFQQLLPHGRDYKPLTYLMSLIMRDQLAYDIKLSLAPDECQPMKMSQEPQARLGWTTLLNQSSGTSSVLIRGQS